jgi:hypothetical protein
VLHQGKTLFIQAGRRVEQAGVMYADHAALEVSAIFIASSAPTRGAMYTGRLPEGTHPVSLRSDCRHAGHGAENAQYRLQGRFVGKESPQIAVLIHLERYGSPATGLFPETAAKAGVLEI